MKKYYYYGQEISEDGVKAGKVDYGTLLKVCDGIENNSIYDRTDGVVGDWELVNGYPEYYLDSDGNVYDKEEAEERIGELEEQLMETEDDEEIEALESEMELLGKAEYNEVYCYYIISEANANLLKHHSDEIVFYNEELNLYLWGVPFWGADYETVASTVPLNDSMLRE